MPKLLIFTDLHITSPGQTIIDLDPLQRFEQGLSHALDRHPDAIGLILLGDLTHHGRHDQYARLLETLRTCPLPIHATMGNHDAPRPFAAAFPGQVTDEGFAHQGFDAGAARVLLLDTHDHGATVPKHAGWLCPHRLRWLDLHLAAAGDRPLLVACHHPPFAVGFDGMDAIRLQNGSALTDRLATYPGPVHLVCGHIHRCISGIRHGIGFTVLKSPCHQMPLMLGPGTSALSVDEPGAYGIALLDDDGITIHSEDFTLAAPVHEDTHASG